MTPIPFQQWCRESIASGTGPVRMSFAARLRDDGKGGFEPMYPTAFRLGWQAAQTKRGTTKAIGNAEHEGKVLYGKQAAKALATKPAKATKAAKPGAKPKPVPDAYRQHADRAFASLKGRHKSGLRDKLESMLKVENERLRRGETTAANGQPIALRAVMLAHWIDRLEGESKAAAAPKPLPVAKPSPKPRPRPLAAKSSPRQHISAEVAADPVKAAVGVLDAAGKVPASERFGDHKVFIADAFKAWQKDGGKGTMSEFKEALIDLRRRGHVLLTRADLPQVMDPNKVRDSTTAYANDETHFIHLFPDHYSKEMKAAMRLSRQNPKGSIMFNDDDQAHDIANLEGEALYAEFVQCLSEFEIDVPTVGVGDADDLLRRAVEVMRSMLGRDDDDGSFPAPEDAVEQPQTLAMSRKPAPSFSKIVDGLTGGRYSEQIRRRGGA